MCFEASKRAIGRNLNRIKEEARLKKKGWIWVWKWLDKSAYVADRLKSPCYYYAWRIGLNASSMAKKPDTINEAIFRGFHAFRSRKEAEKDPYSGTIVKMKCRVKDIFAASSKQIVCTHLFLSGAEYDKAFRG